MQTAVKWVDNNKSFWKAQGMSVSGIIINEWQRLRKETKEANNLNIN